MNDKKVRFKEWCDAIFRLLENRRFEAARDEIVDMLHAYPERWEPLYLKATCLIMEHNTAQAIPVLERIIAIHPSADAHYNLANAHHALFHFEEWIACLKKVIELDGPTGSVGELAKADLEDFASSIQKSDGISLDHFIETGKTFGRAFEHLASGRFEDAARGFSAVLKVLPQHVPSYGNLGLAYAGLGDRARALECLEKAISIDPGYMPAVENRRILLDRPANDRLLDAGIRRIDFYADRAKEPTSRRSRRSS